MISPRHLQLMASYNAWQNQSLYTAAEGLERDVLTLDVGAFFGSILSTLNHILWADRIWMSRFADIEKPAVGMAGSTTLFDDLEPLAEARSAFDQVIVDWSNLVSADWLAGPLSWHSGAAGREVSLPAWVCVTHFFNHQTHHRGQVHAMLTAADAKPDDTDLFLMPGLETAFA
ncbi:MAG: DinB family protein [Pseudomonadota bacterium]